MIVVIESLAQIPKGAHYRITYTEPTDLSLEIYAFDGQKRRMFFVKTDKPQSNAKGTSYDNS